MLWRCYANNPPSPTVKLLPTDEPLPCFQIILAIACPRRTASSQMLFFLRPSAWMISGAGGASNFAAYCRTDSLVNLPPRSQRRDSYWKWKTATPERSGWPGTGANVGIVWQPVMPPLASRTPLISCPAANQLGTFGPQFYRLHFFTRPGRRSRNGEVS